MHHVIGCAHASAHHRLRAVLARDDGQGTVEYIGLILMLAAVMAVVVKTGGDGSLAKTIVEKVKGTIDDVGAAGRK
jgi:H+/gluconate symporter-like permease